MSEPQLSGDIITLDLDLQQMSDENPIPTPFVIYQNGKTCVFWNVEDYPIPNGVDLESICGDMKKGLVDQGCGEVSIQAYVDRNTLSDRKFSDAKINFDYLPEGDNFAKSSWMLVDILCWAVSNPQSNIIIFSKNMVKAEPDINGYCLEAVDCLEALHSTGFGVLLSKTEPAWELPFDDSALFLTTLFDQKRQRPDTLADLYDPKRQRPDTRADSEE